MVALRLDQKNKRKILSESAFGSKLTGVQPNRTIEDVNGNRNCSIAATVS
jgi:hypothetical protein